LKRVFESRTAEHVPPASAEEDPLAALDRAYEQQITLLRDVKRGIVEVTAARRRLELRAEEKRAALPAFEDRARAALLDGREDLARAALEERQAVAARLRELDQHIAGLREEQERLSANEALLARKIETFRNRKEVLKARHAAAQASVRLSEAVAGLGEEATDTGFALRRAEAATAALRGRGQALDGLLEAGVLGDPTGASQAEAEFDRLMADAAIEDELAALRQASGAGPAPGVSEGRQ
jgi:phage shock protein A